MCMYDKHPLASQDIQYQATKRRSRYTTPFDENYFVCKQINIQIRLQCSMFIKNWMIIRMIQWFIFNWLQFGEQNNRMH